ncbi:MAG: hypothetical protein R3257_06840, partial [bacterium]|nr:hypothetical protein [bacterium]
EVTSIEAEATEPEPADSPSLPRPREPVLTGRTREFTLGSVSCLMSLACDAYGPRELLLRAGKAGSSLNAQGEALSRLVTLLFGMGVDAPRIVEELDGIRSAEGEATLAELIAGFLKEAGTEPGPSHELEEEITEVVEIESLH